MSVSYPLYQDDADAIAENLRALADALVETPEQFPLHLQADEDGIKLLVLEAEQQAGMFGLSVTARAFARNLGVDVPEFAKTPQTIDEIIDAHHEPGNSAYIGTASGHIAIRTKRDGALWHYYDYSVKEGGYLLTGTTQELEVG